MKTLKYMLAVLVAALSTLQAFAGRTVSGNYTLTADEDWTADGTVTLAAGSTIDLAGYRLSLAGFEAGSGDLCITNSAGVVAGYSDLEYLETKTDGNTQHVLTGFEAKDSDVVEMGVRFLDASGTQFLWCDRGSSGTDRTFSALMTGGKLRFDRRSKISGANTFAVSPGHDYVITADYSTRECTVSTDGGAAVSAGTMDDTGSYTPPATLGLFGSFTYSNNTVGGWNNHASVRFYYLKVYRAGELVCHLVPVVKDGVIGVYDREAGAFYENTGSGAFSAVSDETSNPVITNSASGDAAELVLDVPGYQELEYIEAAGAQYIDTGYKPCSTDRIEMKLQPTNVSANQFFFCTRTKALNDSSQSGDQFCLAALPKKLRLDLANVQSGNGINLGTDEYVFVVDGATGAVTANGEAAASVSGGATYEEAKYNLVLFASHVAGANFGNYAKCKCRYFKVYDANGNLKLDLVPAKDVASGAYGMYDRKGRKFLPSSSATAFSAHGEETGPATELENTGVELAGNLKLVKRGGGTFTASKINQSYNGGTVVEEGAAVWGAHGSYNPFGTDSSEIQVCEDGVMEMNGKYYCQNYSFVLNGGTITNSVDNNAIYNYPTIGDLRLEADSQFVSGGRYCISKKDASNSGWVASSLDLAGHKLTIDTPSALFFIGVNAVSAGTIELHGTRLIEFRGMDSDLRKARVVVTDGGQLRVAAGTTVKLGDYTSAATAADNNASYSGKIELYGTFTPNTDCFRGCEIQPGATIDVSGRTSAMPLESNIGGNCADAARLVTFAGGTVYINLGSRSIAEDEAILSWTEDSAPSNLANVTFIAVTPSGQYRLSKQADGLYRPCGLTITFY